MNASGWDKVFECYQQQYSKIFRFLYPAKNSTGFPERNLSVNFIKGYEKARCLTGEEIISWYEFQFGNRNNFHVDAVLWNTTLGELYLIESKRFNNPSVKIPEIHADIERIHALAKELRSEYQTPMQRISLDSISKIYGVILADAWSESKAKTDIIKSYNEHCFANKYLQLADSITPSYDVRDFDITETLQSYKLLSMFWEIAM